MNLNKTEQTSGRELLSSMIVLKYAAMNDRCQNKNEQLQVRKTIFPNDERVSRCTSNSSIFSTSLPRNIFFKINNNLASSQEAKISHKLIP